MTTGRAGARQGALKRNVRIFGERADPEIPDLKRAIEKERPDILLIDANTWGAAQAQRRRGSPG
jgi:hypothetical protein